jgi:methyl-accepting chemotaxis protein
MKISVGAKLAGAFLLITLIAAGLGGVGYWNQTRLTTIINRIYLENVRGLDRAADLIGLTNQHYRYLVEHALTPSEARMAQLRAMEQRAIEDFEARYQRFEEDEINPELRAMLNQIYEAWHTYLRTATTVSQRTSADGGESMALMVVNEVNPLFTQLDLLLDQFGALNRTMANQGYSDGMEVAMAAQQLMTLLLVIGVLISAILGVLLTRSIAIPVKRMTKRAAYIAQGAIYQEELNLKRKDEIGELANAFDRMIAGLSKKSTDLEKIAEGNLDFTVDVISQEDVLGNAMANMQKKLNEVLLQVTETVEQVSVGAGQVSSASQNLSQGATEQASSVEEITSSMIQLSSQSKQNSSIAQTANKLANSARTGAKDGDSQMQKLLNHMKSIDSSSEEIKKIITVIDDIAFQINLLALNANVEAARAGQHGRGFAVVAEEVRNLAVRSAESVKQTSEKIEHTIGAIQAGNQIADETSEKFREIVESVTKVADLMEEISAASEEQSAGLEQINAAVEQIDQVTQTNTSSAEQTAAAAEELSAQASALQDQIKVFKLRKAMRALGYGGAHGQYGGFDTSGLSPELLSPEILEVLQKHLVHLQLGTNNKPNGSNSNQKKQPALAIASGSQNQPKPKGIVLNLEDEEFDEF